MSKSDLVVKSNRLNSAIQNLTLAELRIIQLAIGVTIFTFIRLRNVSLGYTLPRAMVAKAGLQRVKLYANATNLLTFTGYSGADPEVNAAADFSNATVQGLDFSTPPHPRTFVIGINITY